jgi:acetyl esterase/lipase
MRIACRALLALAVHTIPSTARTEAPMPQQDFTQMKVVHQVAGMDGATVKRDIVYRTVADQSLAMDVYSPPDAAAPMPAVILIHGGPVPAQARPKDWGVYVSYGRMLAASGLVAVAFNHRFHDPAMLPEAGSDVAAAVEHVRTHAATLGIDKDRIAIWAFSGGGPFLSLPLRGGWPFVRALVAYYAALDLQVPPPGASSGIGTELRQEFSPLRHVPEADGHRPSFFIARAGRDNAWLNASIDRFVQEALARNLPLELMTHPSGQHGFDILDDDARSREIIDRTLAFLKRRLAE